MPRPRTGTIHRYEPSSSDKPCSCGATAGHYVVRVTAPDGSRPLFHLDPSPQSKQAEAQALKDASDIGNDLRARRLGATPRSSTRPSSSGDDAQAWFDAWLADRKRRGIVRDVTSDIETYIKPATSSKHVRNWTADDLRALSRSLDEHVQSGRLAWKTATNIWGVATKMCADAVKSKHDAIRCRDDNPAINVAGPDRGVKKSKQFLYPSEFLKFVECGEVPLVWRRAVAVAVYVYPRTAELRGLSLVDDVDLEHGTIHIHRSLDGAGNAKPTKTKTPRRLTIEANLRPLLQAMHDEGLGHVEIPATQSNLSSVFRRWLTVAGIKRVELHKTTATRKAMTFYDLRATGLTWMAVRGDDPLKIMQRAGHTDFQTTQGYVRLAEAIGDGFGDLFPPLPSALLGSLRGANRHGNRHKDAKYAKSLCEGEDLNLHELSPTRT